MELDCVEALDLLPYSTYLDIWWNMRIVILHFLYEGTIDLQKSSSFGTSNRNPPSMNPSSSGKSVSNRPYISLMSQRPELRKDL